MSSKGVELNLNHVPKARLSASPGNDAAESNSNRRLASFCAVVAQFGVLVVLVSYWDIEGLSFARVMQLSFVGFIVHHFLPHRFRLSFFALLSITATVLVLGDIGPQKVLAATKGTAGFTEFVYRMLPGTVLIITGLGLVGLCHLPLRLSVRVTVLLLAAAGFSVIRANSTWFPDIPAMVWIILGSMFVFRLMVYLYDLQHRTAPFSLARSAAYFFMLPNVCFPLFPLVDYKMFCTTYYNEDWRRVYQTGIEWMLRGVYQLLIYQVVYQFAPLDPAQLSSSLGVAGFVLSTYLLYLHLSGQFHLIVGLLHMFGFNLPETHHLYLLASSFTDFWRRINIYWKDFIMKLFFYPSFFKLRKLGTLKALSIATLFTFFVTWFLHSWQWFWIRGSFLLTWQDVSFWTILAFLVLINGLYEATAKSKRKLAKSSISLRDRLALALKTIGTFTVICLLWTVWSAQSMDELRTLLDAASQPTLKEAGIILLFLIGVGICGMLWGTSTRDNSEGRASLAARPPFHFWHSVLKVAPASLLLLLAPLLAAQWLPSSAQIVARLRNDVLNPRDMNQQRRGYYEELDAGKGDNRQQVRVQEPEGWNAGTKVLYRPLPTFLESELVPSSSGVLSGVRATSNRLGLRDREYEKHKPPGTHRMLLLGSSHEVGVGVEDSQTFENLVEDQLNGQRPSSGVRNWEIFNMSVAGNSVFQKMLRLEEVGFSYNPDTVLFVVNPFEWHFVIEQTRKTLTGKITPPPDYLQLIDQLTAKAGVAKNTPGLMMERRLRPHVGVAYGWIFQRLAQQCAERGIRPIVVYRPATMDLDGSEPANRAQLTSLARAAGLEVIDLSSAYQGVQDRNTLILARWDDHTSLIGHQLLARSLYEQLLPLLQSLSVPPAATDGASSGGN